MKFVGFLILTFVVGSLPVRERGLKCVDRLTDVNNGYASLPVRERGLKCAAHPEYFDPDGVAPRAGAWIEIVSSIIR